MATAAEAAYYRRDDGKIYIRLNILPECRGDILEVGYVIDKRWEVRAKLGEGSHSEVFCAYDNELQQEVAIKANTSKKRLLSEEAAILRKLEHSQYFCRLIKNPIIDSVHMLIMDMKGPCLGEISNHYSPLSLDTVLRLSIQMIEAIEDLHSAGIIHGDIKPANYVTGLPPVEMGKIFLIDFSLSKKYLTDKNKLIPAEANHSGFPGTIKYCSPVLQQTRQLCRRDDLYSMLYIMLELRAHLPWSSMSSAVDVLRMKLQMTDTLLKEKIDQKLVDFKETVRKLQYQDTPNYTQLKSILESIMQDRKIDKNGIFEWEVNPHRIWRVLQNEDRRRSLSRSRDRNKVDPQQDDTPHHSKSCDKDGVVRERSRKRIATTATQNTDNTLAVSKDKSASPHSASKSKPRSSITSDNDKKPKPREPKAVDSQSSLNNSHFQNESLRKRFYSGMVTICSFIFVVELRRIQSTMSGVKSFLRVSHPIKIEHMTPMQVY